MANEKERFIRLFLLAVILFLIICLMPERVPIHFNGGERRTLLSTALVDSQFAHSYNFIGNISKQIKVQ